MSCLQARILPQLAAISGLPADRLEQMLDTARRTPLPPLPLDPAVADAMLAGRPANHDPKQGAAMLQVVAQGLRLALRQSRDRSPTAQELALLTALTGAIFSDIPTPDPALVQAMRTNLCLRPAPLPLTLPDDPAPTQGTEMRRQRCSLRDPTSPFSHGRGVTSDGGAGAGGATEPAALARRS